MIYEKTTQGRVALQRRDALNLRERQIMVLCNGARAIDELVDLFGQAVTDALVRLESRGLLVSRWVAPAGWDTPTLPPAHDGIAQPLSQDTLPPVPTRFLTSTPLTEPPPQNSQATAQRLSLKELEALANVPPVHATVAPVRAALAQASAHPPARDAAALGAAINEIEVLNAPRADAMNARVYMTQVLGALGTEPAHELVRHSGDVRHDVDILMYLAKGIGIAHAVAGEDVALRVALRASRLLPDAEVPMLLDCALDHVPSDFSLLLYEFVLAGRDTGG